ncbi:hypothetical protein [Lentibacillus amyloliquefaciens]|uniref:hypothetical protein n=1 Tax=Lentibacillus amyloliquefaciens TaxID=1472767 RepID=UPI0012E3439F|nr:hypothetical protein [Lentibacillus amyloliquefaciens]
MKMKNYLAFILALYHRTQLEKPSDQEDLTNHYVEVKFAPTEYSWSTVWENYGF